MVNFKEYDLVKLVSVVLISLLLWGDIPLHPQIEKNPEFSQAIFYYNQGYYELAQSLLEKIEYTLNEEDIQSKIRLHMVLGACYEKMGKQNLAKLYYEKVRSFLDKGLVDKLPEIETFDFQSLRIFQQHFGTTVARSDQNAEAEQEKDEYHFTFKKPQPVSPVDERAVIYSKSKPKKKKKFPWLPVITAGIVLSGIVVYFLFTKKDRGKIEIDAPEIEWIHIPPGEFMMGDNFHEGDTDEQPVHPVYLDGYHISKYEISADQFDRFCIDTGKKIHSEIYGLFSDGPVVQITWADAREFCLWMSEKTGQNIQLPTEAQWERAARGLQQFRYPWGNSPPDCTKANFNNCWHYIYYVFEYEAGQTPSGIHNMAGNVWEWCRDCYGESYYSQSPYQNPRGPETGSTRVIRGGCYHSSAKEIRSANRDNRGHSERSGAIGLRIVREL